jgi:hypothetical protein
LKQKTKINTAAAQITLRCCINPLQKTYCFAAGKCAEIAQQAIYCNLQQHLLKDESSQYQRNKK